MYNVEISLLLNQIADFLEVEGMSDSQIKAFRQAVLRINQLSYCLDGVYNKKGYLDLSGMSKLIKGQIEEVLLTGSCRYYQYLKEKVPADLAILLSIPGVSPKAVNCLYKEIGVTRIGEVEELAKSRKLRSYPVIGVKTEQNILRGIRMLQNKGREIPLGVALPIAQRIIGILQYLPEVHRLSIIGSVRRMKEIVKNIDILVATKKRRDVLDFFSKLYFVERILVKDVFHISVIIDIGVMVNLHVVEPENYLNALHYYTGNQEYMEKLRQIADQWGLKLTKSGVFGKQIPAKLAIDEERDIFDSLDLPYIPPELREGQDVLEAADSGKLPKLVEIEDIKGDLHIHTSWSDGTNTIEEMVEAARSKGYEYLAITDHSKSLVLARGLGEERLTQQLQEIAKLNEELTDFHILTGIEVDILADGSLDFEDKILENLDVVAASIHSNFRQDKETMTNRITTALKNKHVDILTHPTGRLLGRRYPYEMDFEQVLVTAKRMGTILEINSSPDRLDLNDEHANMAKREGIPLAIDTDAHGKDNLDYINFGVAVARRAWLEADDIVNTLSLEELMKKLRK